VSVSASAAVSRAGLDAGGLDISSVTIRPMPSWMPLVLGSGVAAMTLGNTILVAEDRYEEMVSGGQPDLLRHELVHVGQWRREGRIGFLSSYASDYIRNRLIGLNHGVAYRAIGFEAAAYDASEQHDPEWT
jgi:hypothetical protein